jgi:hypothetical protein
MDEDPTHVPGAVSTHPRRFISPWLLTCPQRLGILQATLASFRRTDWQTPLRIHCTPQSGEIGDPEDSPIKRAHLAILRSALDAPGTHFLILEDDVTFNVNLHHNLLHWDLWEWVEDIHFATLYNPGLQAAVPFTPNALKFSADVAAGAQARLFSRACAELILEKFNSSAGVGPQDRQFAILASEFGPLWAHRPSLVQHTGKESTWGGPWHQAIDYDPVWRME